MGSKGLADMMTKSQGLPEPPSVEFFTASYRDRRPLAVVLSVVDLILLLLYAQFCELSIFSEAFPKTLTFGLT